MAKKTKKSSAEEIAKKLLAIRTRMAKDKILNDALTRDFKERLREESRNEAGRYRIRIDTAYRVIEPDLALSFAIQRGLVKVETGKVKDVFRLDEGLRFADPTQYGFEITEIEKVVQKGDEQEE